MKTWFKRKGGRIWFTSAKEKPEKDCQYLCDGELTTQELDRFMSMHRFVCDSCINN